MVKRSIYVKVETVEVDMASTSGVFIQDFINPDQLKSHYVRIIESPEELPYYGHKVAELKERYPDDLPAHALERMKLWNEYTSEVDVPVEVEPGDICLCRHVALVDNNVPNRMRYDELIARVDKGGLYPLNGYLFLSMKPDDSFIKDPRGKWRNRLNEGKVVAQGARVRSYRMRPDFSDDKENWIGRTVSFRPFLATPIEKEAYMKQDSEFSLWKIHKLHVNGYKYDNQP